MRSFRFWTALFLLYLALAVGFTWPLAARMADSVPGVGRLSPRPRGDVYQYYWNLWWFHRAWQRGQNVFECPELFHPRGARLYFNTQTLLNGALAAPFVEPLGLTRAAGIMLWLTLALGALAASALGWEASRSRAGALACGVAFGFCPFVFGRLVDTWNFSTVAPLPLVAWLLLRLAHRPGAGRAAGLGLGLLVAGLSEYTYLVFGLLLCGGMALWRRGLIRWLALAGVVLLAGFAPVLLGAWSVYREGGAAAVARPRLENFAADLADYLTPPPSHPLLRGWDGYQALLKERKYGGPNRPWIGLSVLVLSALALRGAPKNPTGSRGESPWRGSGQSPEQEGAPPLHPGKGLAPSALPVIDFAKWWLAVAGVALVVSLGSTVRVWGVTLSPWWVYDALERVPVLGMIRCPDRYGVLVQLALAVLAGLGAARLRRGAVLGILAFMLFEFLPAPLPLVSTKVPEIIEDLAHAPAPGAVWQYGLNTREMLLYQTVHGRPMVEGYYSRKWPRDEEPSKQLIRLAQGLRSGLPEAEAALRGYLQSNGIRFLLLSPEKRRPPYLALLLRQPWLTLISSRQGWTLYEFADIPSKIP